MVCFHSLFVRVDKVLSNDPSLTLATLAKTLGTNCHYIGTAVHKGAGITFRTFRKGKRLEHAIILLRQGLIVKQVAAEVGYSSPDAFSRFFKMETGRSPNTIQCDLSASVQTPLTGPPDAVFAVVPNE